MKDIPLYNQFDKIELVNKGMSMDKKYHIETFDGMHLLLRIADISEYAQKQNEFEHMVHIYKLGVPIPNPMDFGICNDGNSVYTLMQWIDGYEVEAVLPTLSKGQQYKLGIRSGEILRRIHTYDSGNKADNWSKRYFSVIDERLEAFRTEGVHFDGDELILNYLDTYRYLLQNRPQCHHHGDYHVGNLILAKENQVFVIDWHTVDFDNYGDPWYEFNRLGIDDPAFASGQINGYFDSSPPEDFWRLFAFYLAASTITSIVWAKYFAPELLASIMKSNKDILRWFDDMKNPIPTWYIRDFQNES